MISLPQPLSVRWGIIKEVIILKTILKVIAWAIVAAGAVALWLAGIYVPQIESFGFALGNIYTVAVFCLIEAVDKLRRQSRGGKRK